MLQTSPAGSDPDIEILIEAQEAYPEMERAFLNAREEIWASYRVFDLSTKLRSAEAREIGEDWFDLVCHVLKRGVQIRMVLSDFDPIMAQELHEQSWRARRAFIAAGELVGPQARLQVVNAIHPARVGLLPRLALWPRVRKELSGHAERLNRRDPAKRTVDLECSPGLCPWLVNAGGDRLRAARWPPPELVPATHHQKIAVFDRDLLCIGGLDLDERRYDDKGHRRRRDETWHDVQLMCRGPVVADAQRHLESFLDVVAGRRTPQRSERLLTTLSTRRRWSFPFLSPRPRSATLAQAHFDLISRARRLVYLETQFFRDRRLARALATAARENPELTLILIVPAAPEDVAFDYTTSADARFGEHLQARCMSILRKGFGDRLAVCTPVSPGPARSDGRDTFRGSPIIYVHAKVSIFDDTAAIVSSANLNGRSLRWDTEAGIRLDRPADVAALTRRTFAHWLGPDADRAFFDPATAAANWRDLAARNTLREPGDRQGFLVSYDHRPAQRFGRPLPGVPDEMV